LTTAKTLIEPTGKLQATIDFLRPLRQAYFHGGFVLLNSRVRLRAIPSVFAVAALAVAGLTACSDDGSVQAKVVRVIDGDTFDAEYNGRTETVRLLNINTPETKHPNKIVECQGPEATKFLQEKLPQGSSVTLRFDQEKTDGYGRVLAAAFLGQELINASIARAGLGIAEQYGANGKYFGDVKAAQDEAAEQKVGLYQEQLTCTPAALAEQQVAALAVPAEPGPAASAAEVATAAAAIGAAITTASTVRTLINGAESAVVASARGTASIAASSGKLATSLAGAESRFTSLNKRASSLKLEEERKAAEAKAAEERRLKEESDAKAAAEARAASAAAAKAAAEAAARYVPPAPKYVAPAPAPAPAPSYVAPAPAPQNPYPGYTGPRCYAPGGKTWTPCPGR
jgi:micrococcal nuclease